MCAGLAYTPKTDMRGETFRCNKCFKQTPHFISTLLIKPGAGETGNDTFSHEAIPFENLQNENKMLVPLLDVFVTVGFLKFYVYYFLLVVWLTC